jgi:hypothetical protein
MRNRDDRAELARVIRRSVDDFKVSGELARAQLSPGIAFEVSRHIEVQVELFATCLLLQLSREPE